jgi:hypothetical protein
MRMLERVGLHPPGREDHDRRDGDAERTEEVGEHVPERGLDVEAVAACAGEDDACGDVHHDAEEGDGEHPPAEHVSRIA